MMQKIARELVKIAKLLIAVPNYFRMLKKKKLGRGSYAWSGEIDGVNVYVVRNAADPSVGSGVWWDIQVGAKEATQTGSRDYTTDKEVLQIIEKMLKKELAYREKMSGGKMSFNDVIDRLDDMKLEYSLTSSKINKINDAVWKKMSDMDELELESARRKGRNQMVRSEDIGDERGAIEGALTLVYAKNLLKMF